MVQFNESHKARGLKLYRILVPAGKDYKGKSFVEHYQYCIGENENDAINVLIWQVGYPDGLEYTAIQGEIGQNGIFVALPTPSDRK